MKLILLGAPGAGKGTLAESLKDQTGYLHVSTGEMLRAAVKAESTLGQKVTSYMESGNLVPDSLVLEMILYDGQGLYLILI